jgi:UDP-N-acetylmuramoylalanine--D-glutamate ligase
MSNIIAASEIANKIGIKNDNICNVINEFEGLEHRFEYFYSNNGIDFINDSKSTNIDSAIKAIESISKKMILILGGIAKEDDFSEISLFKKNILKIIVYGESRNKIYDSLSSEIKIEKIEQFEDAINAALKSAVKSNVVLLSPACASFDQFKNYEERGIKFKNMVERFYA